MGRFYKTSKPEYLDFIYKQPKNLLLQAVQKASEGVDKNLAQTADLYGRLKSEALNPDVKRRDELIDAYKTKIDNLASKIYENPMEYRGYTPDIKGLSDDIQDNLERGELAAIASNVKARKTYSDKLDAQVKAKQIDQTEANYLLNKYDADFKTRKGTLYAGPSAYQSYNTGYFSPDVDVFKRIDEMANGWKANQTANAGWNFSYHPSGDRYIVTNKETNEVVNEEEVMKSLAAWVGKDEIINQYYDTRSNLGYFDPNKKQADLATGIALAASKYGYVKNNKSVNATADSLYGIDKKYNLEKAALLETNTIASDATTTESDTYTNNNLTNSINETISNKSTNVLDLYTQNQLRKAYDKAGYEQKVEKLPDGKVKVTWLDKKTKQPITQEQEQKALEEAKETTVNLNQALSYGNKTGDYNVALQFAEASNNNEIIAEVKKLQQMNTPGTSIALNNSAQIHNAFKNDPEFKLQLIRLKSDLGYLSRSPEEKALLEQQLLEQAIQQSGVTKVSNDVTITNKLTSNEKLLQSFPSLQALVGDKSKDLVQNNSLLKSDNAVLYRHGVDKNGNMSFTAESGFMNDLLGNRAIPRKQLEQKRIKIEDIQKGKDEGDVSLTSIANLLNQGNIDKSNVEVYRLDDGEYIIMNPKAENGIYNTTDRMPQLDDDNGKWLHQIEVYKMDNTGNLVESKNGGGTTEIAWAARSFNDYTLEATLPSGQIANLNEIVMSDENIQTKNIASKIREGVQVAENMINRNLNFGGIYDREGATMIDDPGYHSYRSEDDLVQVKIKNGSPVVILNGEELDVNSASTEAQILVAAQKIIENKKNNTNNTGIK